MIALVYLYFPLLKYLSFSVLKPDFDVLLMLFFVLMDLLDLSLVMFFELFYLLYVGSVTVLVAHHKILHVFSHLALLASDLAIVVLS